jgi:hypothetical protein
MWAAVLAMRRAAQLERLHSIFDGIELGADAAPRKRHAARLD